MPDGWVMPYEIWARKDLSHPARILWARLLSLPQLDGYVDRRVVWIAKDLGVCVRTVHTIVVELVCAGCLRIERGSGNRRRYYPRRVT